MTDKPTKEVSTLAKITAEWIKEKAKEVWGPLEDGFQWADLFKILPDIASVADAMDDLSLEEKKEAAVAIINHILDETDTPWVPDSLVDPILKKAAPYLIDLAFNALKKDKAE